MKERRTLMNIVKNPLNAYREVSVRTASGGKLIVMLYEEVIKQLTIAISLLQAKGHHLDKVHNSLTKTQDIITELVAGLDFERGGEIAHNLMNLYIFFLQKIREGNLRKDIEPLIQVKNLMADLRTAWVQIANVHLDDSQTSQVGVNIAG